MTTQFKATIKRKDAVFTLSNEATWSLLLSTLNENFPKSTPNLLYYLNPKGILVSLFDDEGLCHLLNSGCKEVHIWNDPTAALNDKTSLSETLASVNIDNGGPITDISSSIAFENLGVIIDSHQPTLQNSSAVSYAIGNLVTVLLKYPNSVDLSSFERWLALMSTELQRIVSSESESESETSSSEIDCISDNLPQSDHEALDTNEKIPGPTSSEIPTKSACNCCRECHHKSKHHGFHHPRWSFTHHLSDGFKHESPFENTDISSCFRPLGFGHGFGGHGRHGHGKGPHHHHGRHGSRHSKGDSDLDRPKCSHESADSSDERRHRHHKHGRHGGRHGKHGQPEDTTDCAKDASCTEKCSDSTEKADPTTDRPESRKKGKHHHGHRHSKSDSSSPKGCKSKGRFHPCMDTDCLFRQRSALYGGRHCANFQGEAKECPASASNTDQHNHCRTHSPCEEHSKDFGGFSGHNGHGRHGKFGGHGGHGMHGSFEFGGRGGHGGHGMHGGFGFGGRGGHGMPRDFGFGGRGGHGMHGGFGFGGRGGHGMHGRHGGFGGRGGHGRHGRHGRHGAPEGFGEHQNSPPAFDFQPTAFQAYIIPG
ncbi:hypothetical protein CLU79DRAFT_308135 [Phycomyces nitens]|nr:hypothetical protein CLU79DRAFT_308135 [Phycomyces nitens]